MATTKKALATAEELKSELALRIPSLACVLTFDTDSSPVLTIGTNAASATGALVPGAVIKVMPITWALAKDILGLDSSVYTPHVVKICFEANYASTVDTVADTNSWAVLLPIVAACVMRGMRTEVYQSAFATAPAVAQMTTSNLKSTYEPSLQYPMVSSQ